MGCEQGTGASLEGIAHRAGVAIGTLYGHFPNRRALVGAVLRERNETLFDEGDALTAEPPEQALRRWVDLVVEHAATYQGSRHCWPTASTTRRRSCTRRARWATWREPVSSSCTSRRPAPSGDR